MPEKSKTSYELMQEWPSSWAGVDADEKIGRRMVDELIPFVADLETSGLSKKTMRRHVNWLWAIGGEVIRGVHDEPKERKWSGRKLIERAVENGEAPLIRGVDEAEQSQADCTARKLRKFLTGSRG